MTWWPKLQPHQVALLRRIAEGTEPVTSRESTLARTVYALRGRKLVTTPRTAGVWTAVITDAGRHYLDHGEHLDKSPHADAHWPGGLDDVEPDRDQPRIQRR